MHVSATAAQAVEFCKASFAAGHRLSVDQACGHLERAQCVEDEREGFGPVVPVGGDRPPSGGPPPRQEPEAIMLDFMNLIAAGRWMLDRARQARLGKVGEGPQTPQHALLNAAENGQSRIRNAAD